MITQAILQVVLQGQDVALELPDSRRLPRGSLVQIQSGSCATDLPVAVVQLGDYREPDTKTVTLGAALCLEAAVLAWPDEVLAQDGRLGALEMGWGGQLRLRGQPVALEEIRPLEPGEIDALRALQRSYTRYFGPIPLSELRSSHSGYVALPLWPRPEASLQATLLKEDLQTPLQQEKQVTHDGPFQKGVPVYTHFTGADLPFSDIWGTPEFVDSLLGLLAGWNHQCSAQAPAGTCTVAIGDLAWYNARRPDPLGHKDHAKGDCVDLRLFRKDGSEYEAFWNQPDDRPGWGMAYDPIQTGAFLAYVLRRPLGATAFFNDPRFHQPGIGPLKGHDDHIHLCLNLAVLPAPG